MRRHMVVQLAVWTALVILSVTFYPLLPARVAVHFSLHGVPDGFMAKSLAICIVPGVSLYVILMGMVLRGRGQVFITLIVCMLALSQLFFLFLMNMGYPWSYKVGLAIVLAAVLLGEYCVLRGVVLRRRGDV